MADYLKSAFNYLSNASTPKVEHDFAGGNIHVGSFSLRIRRAIAEGGYGVVYEAQDASTGTYFALKRMISQNKETSDSILREISFLKQLNDHPNIIKFYQAASIKPDKSVSSRTEFLIVTELCKRGQLSQYLPACRQERPFSANVILQIMHQTCKAVQHMHNQCPSVIHRDLKIENLLLSDDFVIKLCDFGSASTNTYDPDVSWSALNRLTVQEELEKFTTPMYRAPEMLDLYLNYPIGTSSDIWALGCVLFYLCCTYHPFEDSSKLAILNANYTLPATSKDNKIFHNLIRQMLLIDPRQRPNITEVLGELSEMATARKVPVTGAIPILNELQRRRPILPDTSIGATVHSNPQATATKPAQNPSPNPPTKSPCPPKRPPSFMPPSSQASSGSIPKSTRPLHAPASVPTQSQQTPVTEVPQSLSVAISPSNVNSGNVLGILKDGAGNLLRNLRDASTRVLESVSATLSSEVDFQLITSRIAVMSYPAETGLEAFANSNSIEEVQTFLNLHYPKSYAVYNLSPRVYRSDRWFDGRVSHRVFDAHHAPSLRSLVELCLNARLWLNQKVGNICVVHCTDGRAASAVFICALLCFCRLFDNACPAVQLFSSKRCNPRLTASQIRYIDYVAQLAHRRVPMPHRRPLQLIKLTVAPIPAFNKSKNGCRPYVEICEGKVQVLSTFTSYECLRSFVLEDGKIEFTFNGISVMGDLTVIVYHCRSSFPGRNKYASVKIAQFQLHTGFIEPNQTELIYFKSDLDHLDSTTNFSNFTSRYADSFHLTLEFMVSPTERPRQGSDLVYPWEAIPPIDSLRPKLCVSNEDELHNLMADFGRFNITNSENKGSEQPAVTPPSDGGIDHLDSETVATDKLSETKQHDHIDLETDRSLDAAYQPAPSPSLKEVEEPNQPSSVIPNQPSYDWDTTPVADLLGFSSDHSTPPVIEIEQPDTTHGAILIDVSSPGSLEKDVNLSQGAQKNFFMDDLLGFQASTNSVSTDWSSTTVEGTDFTNTNRIPSNNPFDPFGTPTGDAGDYLTVAPEPSVHRRPSPDFESFLGGHTHLSTSVSTSDLNSSRFTRVYQSASCASLSSDGAQTSPLKPPRAPDPFADLSDLFDRSRDVPSSRSTGTQQQSDRASYVSSATAPDEKRPTDSASSHAQPFNRGSMPNVSTSNQASAPPPTTNRSGARPQVKKDAFSDLLGEFGSGSSSSSSNQPRTVNDMRRQLLAKTTDPDQLKVLDWAHGKDRNVRALLCSLPSILWEGVRWKPVTIADLMNPDQVKRQYRNAARAVHPDKWMNTENENLARMIFVELNDAMTEFEKEPASTLSF